VYWPAMLMSAGLPLPTDLVVHGYITTAGQKLSKSLGNAVDPAHLISRYGQDAVRYYLLSEFSPFADGDFSEERLAARYTSDLANALGNLVSRTTAMIVQYSDGVVPERCSTSEAENVLDGLVQSVARECADAMSRYDHRESLARIWDLVRALNAYVDERAPWRLAKAAANNDGAAMVALDTMLRTTLDSIRFLGFALRPFIPNASKKILLALGEPSDTDLNTCGDMTGRILSKALPLFPRLDG
jgi:methionyl-tRNA synthetase